MCNHNAALKYFIAGLNGFASEPIFKSLQASNYADYLATSTIPGLLGRETAYMSYPLTLRIPAELGMYFNNYDGTSSGLAGSIQNHVATVSHPAINITLIRPTNFERYDFEQIAEPNSNLLLGQEATSDCGLFIAPTANDPVRISHGTRSYKGAFPWSVCIYNREHVHLQIDRDPTSGEFKVPDKRKSDVFIVPTNDFNDYVNRIYFNAYSFGEIDSTSNGMCTKTIVDNRHIITAAHCFS